MSDETKATRSEVGQWASVLAANPELGIFVDDLMKDAAKLDGIVHALGIEDSTTEPADAIAHIIGQLDQSSRALAEMMKERDDAVIAAAEGDRMEEFYRARAESALASERAKAIEAQRVLARIKEDLYLGCAMQIENCDGSHTDRVCCDLRRALSPSPAQPREAEWINVVRNVAGDLYAATADITNEDINDDLRFLKMREIADEAAQKLHELLSPESKPAETGEGG